MPALSCTLTPNAVPPVPPSLPLQVLTPADEIHHTNKHNFKVPFVCGCRDLGEALRRIAEGAAMIRTKVGIGPVLAGHTSTVCWGLERRNPDGEGASGYTSGRRLGYFGRWQASNFGLACTLQTRRCQGAYCVERRVGACRPTGGRNLSSSWLPFTMLFSPRCVNHFTQLSGELLTSIHQVH